MASSGSPCAACKFLRRKCTSECVFAPYFPPDQPQKFANVHKIFGASNISKLLNELPPHQREDAVNSLAYEADARVKDPVYGCVGAISILQQRVSQLQNDLVVARSDLARYAGAGIVQVASPTSVAAQHVSSLGIGMGLPGVRTRDQMFSREQLVDLSREQHLGGARQSYESLAHQRVTGPFLPQLASFPHERHGPGLGNDVGGPSGSGAGGQMGHFSSDPRS